MQRHKPAIQAIPVSEVPRTRLYKILVVDDDERIANSTAAVLASAGYECRALHSGAAAIKVASEFVPDLVLSDVMMPDVNGVQVCLRIREQVPCCSMLLFSGDVCRARLLMEQAEVNFTLLTKPIAPADLFRQIEILLQQRLPLDELSLIALPTDKKSRRRARIA